MLFKGTHRSIDHNDQFINTINSLRSLINAMLCLQCAIMLALLPQYCLQYCLARGKIAWIPKTLKNQWFFNIFEQNMQKTDSPSHQPTSSQHPANIASDRVESRDTFFHCGPPPPKSTFRTIGVWKIGPRASARAIFFRSSMCVSTAQAHADRDFW